MDTQASQSRWLDLCSFNGAMTFQPWIQADSDFKRQLKARLQWSHDLSAMDTGAAGGGAVEGLALQWSHDLSAMDTLPSSNESNG